MKLAQMLAVSAVCAALLMGLSGCDMAKPPAPSNQPEQLQQPENPQPAAPSSTIES